MALGAIGLATGYTGLSYPLVVVALGLCAFGPFYPGFGVVFGTLVAMHYFRMKDLFGAPIYLARSGLIPVLGIIALVFLVISVFRAFIPSLIAAMVILVLLSFRFMWNYLRNPFRGQETAMKEFFFSESGRHYWKNFNELGELTRVVTPNGQEEERMSILTEELNNLEKELRERKIDPDKYKHYSLILMHNGAFPGEYRSPT